MDPRTIFFPHRDFLPSAKIFTAFLPGTRGPLLLESTPCATIARSIIQRWEGREEGREEEEEGNFQVLGIEVTHERKHRIALRDYGI